MKVSLILTVLNEAKTLPQLWHSILNQTQLPDEVIVCDGGSRDDTVKVLQELSAPVSQFATQILVEPGNRSHGRNAAIAQAQGQLIACTDAGCILQPSWLAELIAKQKATKADVVAGYYEGAVSTSWQAAVVPYVLVMPDKLPPSPEIFLPATRSMLCTKKAWEKVGGFDEALGDNEDFAFAHALKKAGLTFSFAPHAIAAWVPPTNWKATATMFFRFARGDSYAKLWRPKIALIFARYFLVGLLLLISLLTKNFVITGLTLGGILLYLCWSIQKNYRYAQAGWWWLPVLQLTADGAVMAGTIAGLLPK